jgi:hypothetical protein
MREPESGDDSADPAMTCIIALEEKRLGRFLNLIFPRKSVEGLFC